MGRWIYFDGMRNGVWTAHSLALAFFFGPTGIVSHLLTRGVVKVFRWDVEDIMSAGTRDVAPSAADGVSKQMLKDAEKQVRGRGGACVFDTHGRLTHDPLSADKHARANRKRPPQAKSQLRAADKEADKLLAKAKR